MRASAAAVAAAAVILVPAAGAEGPQPITPITPGGLGSATAVAAPDGVAARPVELRLSLGVELQCGRLQGRSILVALPAAMRVEASIPRSAVLVNDRPVAAVSVTGHSVRLTTPAASGGVICDVMAPGKVSIVFTRAAGVGNPRAAGTYTVTLRAGRTTGSAHLSISA
jgi:hypothetical protein